MDRQLQAWVEKSLIPQPQNSAFRPAAEMGKIIPSAVKVSQPSLPDARKKVWASQSPRASSGVQWKLFHLSQFNFAPWKVTTTQLPQIAEGWETPVMKDPHRERKGLFFHPHANEFSIFQHNPQLSSKEFLYLSFNRVFHSYQKPSFLHIAVIKLWHYKTWSI